MASESQTFTVTQAGAALSTFQYTMDGSRYKQAKLRHQVGLLTSMTFCAQLMTKSMPYVRACVQQLQFSSAETQLD